MPSLLLHCPHCEHGHDDDFEVLDPDQLDAMRCEACAAQFWFAIMECHACEHEEAFTWQHEPAPNALDLLTCERCGNTFRVNDGAGDEEYLRSQ